MSEITEMQKLMTEVSDWANETFGKERRTVAILAHLSTEVGEAIDAVRRYEQLLWDVKDGKCSQPAEILPILDSVRGEFADCLILLLNAVANTGMNADSLIEAAWRKHEINKKRK